MNEIDIFIETEIKNIMNALNIDRMPTSCEVRRFKVPSLDNNISKTGGYIHWASKLNIPHKKGIVYYDEETAKNKILEVVKDLNLKRMPTSEEITRATGNGSLHGHISRYGGYRYFADLLNLELKDSETKLGQDYEEKFAMLLEEKGYQIKRMTTGHPYDLLVDNTVKVDIKVARPHMLRGESRVHTFGINKRYASCDIYITIALDEKEEIEKILIIPSHHLRVVTLCIGKKSKYDIYENRFDYLDKYKNFYKTI